MEIERVCCDLVYFSLFFAQDTSMCVIVFEFAESKNKRVTLKQKNKVLKKVKLHHKKKAKEAKKLGMNKKPKVEKNPDNDDRPLTEQELKDVQARRAKALEARQAKAPVEIEQKKDASIERVFYIIICFRCSKI